MRKVKALKNGSKIALINVSSGINQVFPHVYESGIEVLKNTFGFEVIEMTSAHMTSHELYLHPERRAEAIMDAFLDPTIDGIIAIIGGDDSNRMLPYLDLEAIKVSPKFFMGFSDCTTLLTVLNQQGMITFHGPTVMAGFAQIPTAPKGYVDNVKAALFGTYPVTYEAYDAICHDFLDWKKEENRDACGSFTPYEGLKCIHGKSVIEGTVWGGCIEVLEFTKGTDYWPDKVFFKDKILLLETSEDHPSPEQVTYFLRNYGLQGILDELKGIVFALPRDYSNEERERLRNYILDMVTIEFPNEDISIVIDGNFGHTYPIDILPFGTKVRFDAEKDEVTLIESPFELGV